MSFMLAELFVQIDSRGWGPLGDQIRSTELGMRRVASATDAIGAAVSGLGRGSGRFGGPGGLGAPDPRDLDAYQRALTGGGPTEILPPGTDRDLSAAAERAGILAEAMRRVAEQGKAAAAQARELKVGAAMANLAGPGLALPADPNSRPAILAEAMRRAAAEKDRSAAGAREMKIQAAMANLTQGPATAERVSPLEGQMKGLNRERRELLRLQRLSTFLDAGELKTMGALGALRMRATAHTRENRNALKEELDWQVRSTAAARGYGEAQTALFGVLARTHAALGNFSRGLARVQEAFVPVNRLAGAGFAALSGGMLSLAYAGMRGTVEGNALSYRFQLLAREAAGFLAPAIYKVIDGVQALAGWFHNLSPQVKTLALNLGIGAAAGLGVAYVLTGPLLAGVQAAVVGIGELIMGSLTLDSALGGLPLIFGAVVTGVVALTTGTEAGRKALAGLWSTAVGVGKAFQPLLNVLGNFTERVGKIINDRVLAALGMVQGDLTSIADALLPAVENAADALNSSLAITLDYLAQMGPTLDELVRDNWTQFFNVVNVGLATLNGQLAGLAGALQAFRAMELSIGKGISFGKAWEELEKENERMRKGLGGSGGGPSGLTPAAGGREDAAATWLRIQESIFKNDVATRTAKAAEETSRNTAQMARDIAAATKRPLMPAIGV